MQAAPWVSILIALPVTLALALGSARIGELCIGRRAFRSPWERGAIATAIGLGLVSHALLLVGLAGLLYRPVAGVMVAGLACAGLGVGRRLARAVGAAWQNASAARRTVAIMAAILLLPSLLVALRPPVAFDATMYHLAYVKGYAATHSVVPQLNLRYPVFPQLAEMLFTLVYLVAGEAGPPLVSVLFAAVTVAALNGLGRRVARPGAGLVAAALWLGCPLVVWLSTSSYIDISLAAYCTCATVAHYGSLDHPSERGWPLIAGAAVGFTASCKYLGLVVAVCVGLLFFIAALRQRRVAPILLFAGAGLATLLPWYVYITWYSGSPVFPFLGDWFGHWLWSDQDLAMQMDDLRRLGKGHDLWFLLRLPFDLTFGHRDWADNGRYLPLFIPTLVAAAFGLRREPRLRPLGMLIVAFGLVWFFSTQDMRYLAAISGLFAVLFVGSVAALGRPPLALVCAVSLGVLVLPAAQSVADLATHRLPLTLPQRDAFIGAHYPAYPAYQWLNQQTTRGTRVYALNFPDMFYFADFVHLGDWFGPGRFPDVFSKLDDPEALYAHLTRLEVGFLLMHTKDVPQSAAFASRFHKCYSSQQVTVFRL